MLKNKEKPKISNRHGIRANLRKVSSENELFKAGIYVAICVLGSLFYLAGRFPSASAQCAIRKNLPVFEPAVASRVWNISHTDRYR